MLTSFCRKCAAVFVFPYVSLAFSEEFKHTESQSANVWQGFEGGGGANYIIFCLLRDLKLHGLFERPTNYGELTYNVLATAVQDNTRRTTSLASFCFQCVWSKSPLATYPKLEKRDSILYEIDLPPVLVVSGVVLSVNASQSFGALTNIGRSSFCNSIVVSSSSSSPPNLSSTLRKC